MSNLTVRNSSSFPLEGFITQHPYLSGMGAAVIGGIFSRNVYGAAAAGVGGLLVSCYLGYQASNRVTVENFERHLGQVANDVRTYGNGINEATKKRLQELQQFYQDNRSSLRSDIQGLLGILSDALNSPQTATAISFQSITSGNLKNYVKFLLQGLNNTPSRFLAFFLNGLHNWAGQNASQQMPMMNQLVQLFQARRSSPLDPNNDAHDVIFALQHLQAIKERNAHPQEHNRVLGRSTENKPFAPILQETVQEIRRRCDQESSAPASSASSSSSSAPAAAASSVRQRSVTSRAAQADSAIDRAAAAAAVLAASSSSSAAPSAPTLSVSSASSSTTPAPLSPGHETVATRSQPQARGATPAGQAARAARQAHLPQVLSGSVDSALPPLIPMPLQPPRTTTNRTTNPPQSTAGSTAAPPSPGSEIVTIRPERSALSATPVPTPPQSSVQQAVTSASAGSASGRAAVPPPPSLLPVPSAPPLSALRQSYQMYPTQVSSLQQGRIAYAGLENNDPAMVPELQHLCAFLERTIQSGSGSLQGKAANRLLYNLRFLANHVTPAQIQATEAPGQQEIQSYLEFLRIVGEDIRQAGQLAETPSTLRALIEKMVKAYVVGPRSAISAAPTTAPRTTSALPVPPARTVPAAPAAAQTAVRRIAYDNLPNNSPMMSPEIQQFCDGLERIVLQNSQSREGRAASSLLWNIRSFANQVTPEEIQGARTLRGDPNSGAEAIAFRALLDGCRRDANETVPLSALNPMLSFVNEPIMARMLKAVVVKSVDRSIPTAPSAPPPASSSASSSARPAVASSTTARPAVSAAAAPAASTSRIYPVVTARANLFGDDNEPRLATLGTTFSALFNPQPPAAARSTTTASTTSSATAPAAAAPAPAATTASSSSAAASTAAAATTSSATAPAAAAPAATTASASAAASTAAAVTASSATAAAAAPAAAATTSAAPTTLPPAIPPATTSWLSWLPWMSSSGSFRIDQ